MARALTTLLLICAVGVAAWFYRSNSFSCGQFNSNDNCLSSIVLDTDSLTIQNPRVSIDAIDLSVAATQALVALEGNAGERTGATIEGLEDYAALVIFDVKTGKPIKVLRELWGAGAGFRGVAFSKDGTLVASYGVGEKRDYSIENSLLVQTVNGDTLYTLRSSDNNYTNDCVRSLEFSADNKFLQCSSTLYNLEEATWQFYGGDEEDALPEFPRLANFSAGNFASSADGVRTERNKTNNLNIVLEFPDGSEKSYPRTTVFNGDHRSTMFSTDGQSFIDVETRKKEDYSILQRLKVMPSTQAVVWSLEGESQTPVELTNTTFEIAWSQDSDYYALLGRDLKLSVFEVRP